MCGGDLEIQNMSGIGVCQHCGVQQTLPRIDDDRRANLYGRANHFRRNHEYDKAMAVYESILSEDRSEAEAYWSLVLCKYGVEYVEDPKTRQHIPTCNRTQYVSIYADEDFRQALANADSSQKAIYEAEARAIDEIQRSILEISKNEKPFDVFICYKEVDATGKRTADSVLAQDLYYQLQQAGFKVFFACITLEDRLGSEYEPYIFAALQSSKVMVVLGTSPEYFNAAWVRNEWSRYLGLIKSGVRKTLIPAYRDMDPYDLPEEFSHLQALDMGKLGFMQDLIRGIKKIAVSNKLSSGDSDVVTTPATVTGQAEPLIRRAFILLEDADWKKADELLEQALNLEPENACAYVGKLLAELQIRKEQNLAMYNRNLYGLINFDRAVRFADEEYRKILYGYNTAIAKRLEEENNEKIYRNAVLLMASDSNNEAELLSIAKQFESISGYEDADMLAVKCKKEAEERKKKRYEETINQGKTVQSSRQLRQVVESLKNFGDYSDSIVQSRYFSELAGKAREAEAAKLKKVKIFAIVGILAIVIIIISYPKINAYIDKTKADAFVKEGNYNKAAEVFTKNHNYDNAFDYWQKRAVDLGDAVAMNNIGVLYAGGQGVSQDYQEAMKWYRKAVDLGDTVAMSNIGFLYANGLGVSQDYQETMKWYRKAVDLGDASAMKYIGALYANGQGVSQDYQEAMKWFRKAADLGEAEAMHIIGEMYDNGIDIIDNPLAAQKWYKNSKEAGYTGGNRLTIKRRN
jgi:TPR repeat protein